MIFDQVKNEVILEGNIKFLKAKQYFEAEYLRFNFEKKNGIVKDIYGLINIGTLDSDLSFLSKNNKEINKALYKKQVTKVNYEGESNVALENSFSSNRKFNITDADISLIAVNRWRFKADEINIVNDQLTSDLIFFTNDPFNKPQLKLKSTNFLARIEEKDNSFSLISKSTWINLDDKLSFPIGRQSISDREKISTWTIGSDYKEKDGFYVQRSFEKSPSENFKLNLTPYILVQRISKNYTKAFPEKGQHSTSDKVINDIDFGDYFALSTSLDGNLYDWDMNFTVFLNSLNIDRLSDATRLILTLRKSINLKGDDENLTENDDSENFLDVKFYNAYRKEINRGFSGEREIYYAKGLTLSNRRLWKFLKNRSNLTLSYDLGEFHAKSRNKKKLLKLIRNTFLAEYSYRFPLWRRKKIDKKIDIDYKYSPKVVKQGVLWNTFIDGGIFVYDDDDEGIQEILSFKTGPEFIFGGLKRKFFDYTKINIQLNYIFKDGVSPFYFDNIDNTKRVKVNLDQQIYGPILFNLESFFIVDNKSDDFGKYTSTKYSVGIKRRAYEINGYYNPTSKAIGMNFKIFNFDYGGVGSKF